MGPGVVIVVDPVVVVGPGVVIVVGPVVVVSTGVILATIVEGSTSRLVTLLANESSNVCAVLFSLGTADWFWKTSVMFVMMEPRLETQRNTEEHCFS